MYASIRIFFLLMFAVAGSQTAKGQLTPLTIAELRKGFFDPPVSARPRALWPWVNGNVSLSQLTFEMEDAKRKGMGGFDKGIASAKSIIVTTVARARNSGMQYNDQRNQLLETGEAPILLEPVVVELRLKKRRNLVVYVLDHVGNRTGQKVPESNGRYILDGRKYKAIYYEIAAE